ncbi:uncharacterized protein PHALS_04309 [Plasmopara halstedii]|uniref:Uncharacterized protein n=1 Tax=Plasmopara halstedii TaxID=4781 RepID=A0A0P1B0N2_PLAHL|nr:uncharacterized protein PHALS_04309 [Plasmopara halstedii]CEG47434.1 hypothetical protein PHALS_04309 [Plasmopara halstedii]|eukprot:XP_024583803.1 hypothetical protein PHALS_04309 [Plasmopara halstedii]
MPMGSEFTPVETGKICGLREAGWTFTAIAAHLGRSPAGAQEGVRKDQAAHLPRGKEGWSVVKLREDVVGA